jgi:hypothetical protein
MLQPRSSGRRVVAWGFALAALVFAGELRAQESPAFELRRGVIADAARAAVYLPEESGGIAAVDLASGRSLWKSDAAALPIATNGRLLLAQAEDKPAAARLRVVVLDVEAGGRKLLESSVALPDDVRASIADGAGRRFRAHAVPEGEGFLISWTYEDVPLIGTARPPGELLPRYNASGAVRVQPATGEVVAVEAAALSSRAKLDDAAEQVRRANDLPVAPWRAGGVFAAAQGGRGGPLKLRRWDALTGAALPERQLSRKAIAFLASESDHLLVSERAGGGGPDDPEYSWSIFSLETGDRIGALRRDVSAAPFLVFAGNVVFESQPFGYRRGETWVDEPLSIRAVRLSTGVPLWTHVVRDLEYRGPMPPAR